MSQVDLNISVLGLNISGGNKFRVHLKKAHEIVLTNNNSLYKKRNTIYKLNKLNLINEVKGGNDFSK